MLSEPRLPVSLVMWLVGIMLSGFGVYMALDSRVRDSNEAIKTLSSRIEKMQTDYEARGIGELPNRLSRIELLLCAGGDAARRSECERQGIKL